MKHLWPWLCAILSGLLLAFCFPPLEQSWLSWIALTPLISAVWFSPRDKKRPALRLFLLGYVTGIVFYATLFFWITTVSFVGWVALPFYLGLFPASWVLFIAYCATPQEKPGQEKSIWLSSLNNLRICALAAAAWVSLEWLRGTLFTGFGWNPLGVALHANIAMIQIARFTGVGGLTFLIVMMNGIAVATIKRLQMEVGRMAMRPHYDFSLTVVLITLTFGYGFRLTTQKAG
ncbi:MAG: hypothetical protein ABIP97_11265, partial [Chthoniobacterales bacterium]